MIHGMICFEYIKPGNKYYLYIRKFLIVFSCLHGVHAYQGCIISYPLLVIVIICLLNFHITIFPITVPAQNIKNY